MVDETRGATTLRLEQIIQGLNLTKDNERRDNLLNVYYDNLNICVRQNYRSEAVEYTRKLTDYIGRSLDESKVKCVSCGAMFGTCSCHYH